MLRALPFLLIFCVLAPHAPIAIAQENSPPSIVTSPLLDVDEGAVYSYTIQATDADGDELTYSAPTLPDWLTFDPATRTLSGTPSQTDVGDHNVSLVVSDGTASVTQNFTVTVNGVNEPPTITSSPPTTIDEGAPYSYVIAVTDTDGDDLTYSAPTLPGWLTFNPSTRTLSGTPDQSDVGVHNVSLTVSDGTASDTQNFTITVSDINDPPTITSSPPTIVDEGTLYSYVVEATDPDDTDTLTYSAPDLPAWLTFDPATRTLSGTPGQSDVGDHDVQLAVSDGTASDTQSFTITVANVNEPPTITTSPPTGADEDALYSYVIEATDPDDGDTLTYSAPTLPAWLSFNPATRTLSGTPSQTDVGDHNVSLTVSDGTASDTQDFTITVANVNDAPVITTSPPTSVNQDTTYTYVVNATDADGDALTYAAPTLPAWLSFNPATRTLSGTPGQSEVGAHDVTLTVADAEETATQSFTLTVNDVNDAPELNVAAIVAPNAVESRPYEFDLAQFFTDRDGDALFFEANVGEHPVGLPSSGNLQLGADGVLRGTPTLADTSDAGPRRVTLTVADRPAGDPERRTTSTQFDLTIQALDRVDIGLAVAADPSPAAVGAPVAWAFTISNSSPVASVDEVTLTAEYLGIPFTFTATAGCTVAGQNLTCTAGPIPADGTVTVMVTGRATQAGDVLVRSEAGRPLIGGLEQIDPNAGNNAAVTTLNVGQSFSSGPGQTVAGAGVPTGAAAGDIDGDGFTDLVVVTGAGTGTRIHFSVPMNPDDPNGAQFRRLSATPMSLGDTASNSQDALLVDLDGDGDLDLVVANGAPGAPQANAVFINETAGGQASFVAGPALGNRASYAVAAADFNNNGLPDLVFANAGVNELYLNQGDGTFAAATPIGDGTADDSGDSRALVIADLDGDLLPDVVFANSDGASRAYRNLGGGNFGAGVIVSADPAVSVRASDFSGDGLPDLIFGRDTATPPALPSNDVYVNTSQPGAIGFSAPAATLGASPTLELVAADFSLDGVTDVVSLNTTGTHQIFVGAGNSAFSLHPEQFSSPAPGGAAAGDFNHDGRVDLAVVGRDGVQLFFNDGRGNLGAGDTTPPTLQLLGQPSVTLTVEGAYTDAGATATDALDGDVTSRIVTDNPVNTAVVGTYTVRYTVTDLAGNAATPVTRTVTVQLREAAGGGGGGAVGLALLMLLGAGGVVRRVAAHASC